MRQSRRTVFEVTLCPRVQQGVAKPITSGTWEVVAIQKVMADGTV